MDKKNIFREKSLEQIRSPDQLEDYLKISSPGVWMTLTAILLLLAGFCIWGFFGKLDMGMEVLALSQKDKVFLFVKVEDAGRVQPGQLVQAGDRELRVSRVIPEPARAGKVLTDYHCHVGELEESQWICAVEAEGTLPEGAHRVRIILESRKPASFLTE